MATEGDLAPHARVLRGFPSGLVGGRRVIAGLVDLAVVSLLQLGLGWVFGAFHAARTGSVIDGDGMAIGSSLFPTLDWIWLALIVVAYFALFEALFGATPGKALLGLRVVTLEGRRPTLGAVLLRNLLRPVDALPTLYLVGAVSMWRSPREQRLGDHVAETMVAPAGSVVYAPRGAWGTLARLALAVGLLALLVAGCAAFVYYGRPALVVRDWANANNTVWTDTEAPGTPPLCGPWRPLDSTFIPPGSSGYALPRHITAYSLGEPAWGDGTITYPIRLELLPAKQTNHGGTSAEPVQLPALHDPNTYAGAITLRWAGFLGGGWVVSGGTLDC